MNCKLLLKLGIGLFLITPLIFAANQTDESEKNQKNWALTLKGGLTLNSGNTDSQLLAGGFGFNLKTKSLHLKSELDVFYGTNKNIETVNKGKWNSKFAHNSKKRINLYGTLFMEYDKFAQIAFRGNGGIGIRYTISSSPQKNSYLAASINGEFTDSLAEIAHIHSMRLNLHYTIDKEFSKSNKYSLEVLYTSNLDDFFNDFRIEMKASLAVILKNPLSFKFEIHEKYTNNPILDYLKKNDLILVTSLEIAL